MLKAHGVRRGSPNSERTAPYLNLGDPVGTGSLIMPRPFDFLIGNAKINMYLKVNVFHIYHFKME